MNANEAELVTVIAYSEDGRISQFIKNLIPVTEADRMKAAARLRAEERKAAELVKDTDALVGKAAHLPPEQKPTAPAAARPAQKTVPQRAVSRAPIAAADEDVVATARDATIPARVVAERKKLEAARGELLSQAKALISKKTVEHATYAGKEIGTAVMKAALENIPADAPPGTKLSVNLEWLDAMSWKALQRLRDIKYCATVHTREFLLAYAKAFVSGCREVIAELGFTQHFPASQAPDAGATQDDKCQPEQ
jgi:hypothetical protein